MENVSKKVLLFGTGNETIGIKASFIEGAAEVVGYLDNARNKQDTIFSDGLHIYPADRVNELDFDLIIITIVYYEPVVEQLRRLGVSDKKQAAFFDERMIGQDLSIFNIEIKQYYMLKYLYEKQYKLLSHQMMLWKRNAVYEIGDMIQNNPVFIPQIASVDETVQKVIEGGCSLCRFGDSDFETIRNRYRVDFQAPNPLLAERLLEILRQEKENILIAIPSNFGNLEVYTEEAANGIRDYMDERTRESIVALLDKNRLYYEAYVSRPYIIYKDKKLAQRRFDNLKRIWEKREVLFIEGELTRNGVGNDLFANASNIERIVVPAVNAFDCYDEILYQAEKLGKGKLVLITLGPTARVLAYDLGIRGCQAVDIGQVDIEYEWYLRGVDRRCDVPVKYVHEVPGGQYAEECNDREYIKSIVCRIL